MQSFSMCLNKWWKSSNHETVDDSEFEHAEIESATIEDLGKHCGQRWRDDVILALKQQQNRVVEIGQICRPKPKSGGVW